MARPALAAHDLLGVGFAINVFIASAILWYLWPLPEAAAKAA